MKKNFLYICSVVREHGIKVAYDMKMGEITSEGERVLFSLIEDPINVKKVYFQIGFHSNPKNDISGDISKNPLLFGMRKVKIDTSDVEKTCENLEMIRKCLEDVDDEKPFVSPELKYDIQNFSMN